MWITSSKVIERTPRFGVFNVVEIRVIGQTKLGLPLPRFAKMKILVLGTPSYAGGLLELLHAAPFPKSLVLSLDWHEYDYEYDSVEPLPSCIVHHLEEIKFCYDSEHPKSNFLVEKFLLKNGPQLKSVVIRGRHGELENEIFEQLMMFHKASACLKIKPGKL